MRNVTKDGGPASLTEYRLKLGARYANYGDKDTLRQHLLAEQGHLCCYCMQRIRWDPDAMPPVHEMKIEHWHSQAPDKYLDEQLIYWNLLGACLGNKGPPDAKAHCDSLKGDRDIKFNPAIPEHNVERRIIYLADGTIESDDPQFNDEIKSILNLNNAWLKLNRLATIERVKSQLDRRRGERSRAQIEAIMDEWTSPGNGGALPEYCAVAVYYLRKKLRRLP